MVSGQDVANYRFTTTRRGYHPPEVDALLREVAAELDRLNEALSEHTSREELAVGMLRHATKAAEALVAEAEEMSAAIGAGATVEAEAIRRAASTEADTLIAEASEQSRQIGDVLLQDIQDAEQAVVEANRQAAESLEESGRVLAERATRLRVEAELVLHAADRLDTGIGSARGGLVDVTALEEEERPVSDLAGSA